MDNSNAPVSEYSLPLMHFRGGDVIVRLSDRSESCLLLHSARLRPASPSFQRLLVEEKAMTIQTATGDDMKVYTLALQAKVGTFFLENSRKFSGMELDELALPVLSVPFSGHRLCGCFFDIGVWQGLFPDDFRYRDATYVAKNLKVMFALLYDYQVTAKQIVAQESPLFLAEFVYAVGDILCLSKYYGCFDYVAPKLQALLLSTPGIWTYTCSPSGYKSLMFLAKFLYCNALYVDCLRHAIPTASPQWLAQAMEVPVERAELEKREAMAKHEEAMEELKGQLRLLGLVKMESSSSFVHTTYARAFSYLKQETANDKTSRRLEVICQFLIGQWLLESTKKHGESQAACRPFGADPVHIAPTFPKACSNLLNAANSDDPTIVFGFRVAQKYAWIWNDDGPAAAEFQARLQRKLETLVQGAADIVLIWSARHETHDNVDGAPRNMVTDTPRCGLFPSHYQDILLYEVNETPPWEANLVRQEMRPHTMRNPALGESGSWTFVPPLLRVSMDTASAEWKWTVGLV